jgi:hypothetical protein
LAAVQPDDNLGAFYMADASLQRATVAIEALPDARVVHVQNIAPAYNLMFVSNFDAMHCAVAYGAFADRICRFGGYYSLQHSASSRAALEDGLRRIIKAQQPLSCRLFAYPAALRKDLLSTLPEQAEFACLQPHNTTHTLTVFKLAEDLYMYGYMLIEHTLIWLDAPAQLKDKLNDPVSVEDTDPAPKSTTACAPSEQPPRPKRTGGMANHHMTYNQAPRICRAAIKLREVFDGRLKPFLLPENCTAMDVGAAPGGWTDVSYLWSW